MNCSLCHQPVTYEGFLRIECGTKGCENWDQVERKSEAEDDQLLDYEWYVMCCKQYNSPYLSMYTFMQVMTYTPWTRGQFKKLLGIK